MAKVRFFYCAHHQLASKHGPGNSPHTASIQILDNDSLLNIFYLYRPAIFDGDEGDVVRNLGGKEWDRERWWYKLAHVCQRWRNLILGSASYLGLCLVCTHGTPIAEMLEHSPPLPLIIDYLQIDKDLDITAEEEEGIILALGKNDRIHRVRLRMSVPNMQKLVVAIVEEYPVLEYLILLPSSPSTNASMMLPETLQAPHLRHLLLKGFAFPLGPRLFMSAVDIVAFYLLIDHPSAYVEPNTLLQWISSMPQLETLRIIFIFPVPNDDVEEQLMLAPIMTHVTSPNLRCFEFQGASAYMEAVVHHTTAPRLERLRVEFFLQHTLFVPSLLQFMDTSENLRFDSATFEFSKNWVSVEVYLHEKAKVHALSMNVLCWYLDLQVSCMAQIFNSLSQSLPTVEHLTLEHKEVPQEQGQGVPAVDRTVLAEWSRTEWRKLLRSFSNVKTLRVDDGLVEELSGCLRLDDGEPPLELLPELQKLTYSGSGETRDAFTSFIETRQMAGRSVTLIPLIPESVAPPSHSSSQEFLESSSAIASGSGEAGSDLDT